MEEREKERRRVCGLVAGWPGVGVGGVVWVHKRGVGGVVWVHKQLVWCVVWCGCTSREVDERPNQI